MKQIDQILERVRTCWEKDNGKTEAAITALEEALRPPQINCDGQPQIPSWADKDNPIIEHTPCGVVDPASIKALSVFGDGEEVLGGEEFNKRACALEGAGNACAFDFFSLPENWHYLPDDVDVIVFPKTIFRDSLGDRYVRCLYRLGAKWFQHYHWLGRKFLRHRRVGVLAKLSSGL